jgi:hypothetical protein
MHLLRCRIRNAASDANKRKKSWSRCWLPSTFTILLSAKGLATRVTSLTSLLRRNRNCYNLTSHAQRAMSRLPKLLAAPFGFPILSCGLIASQLIAVHLIILLERSATQANDGHKRNDEKSPNK